MTSGINIYSFFSDIRNTYSRYLNKLLWISKNTYVFRISKIVILDIKNNNFGYQTINIYFGYQKLLLLLSEIVIFDIRNSFYISEINVSVFWISKIHLGITNSFLYI